ncbi:MAG: hypothetical protein JKX81_08135 [Arenicella sp.]|nr:hypothetical protein [Arenicella sp.]
MDSENRLGLGLLADQLLAFVSIWRAIRFARPFGNAEGDCLAKKTQSPSSMQCLGKAATIV